MKAPEESNKEEMMMILRRSRKAFLVEYSCGLLLLGIVGALHFKDSPVSNNFKTFVLVVALLALLVPEISRLFLRYKVSSDKISIVNGFIKQSKKNVHYLPLGFIPDINLKQNRVQRILNYGTIFVEGQGSSGQRSFEIKDVDKPQKVLEMIEKLIKTSRYRPN